MLCLLGSLMPSVQCLLCHFSYPTTSTVQSVSHFPMAFKTLSMYLWKRTTNTSVIQKMHKNINNCWHVVAFIECVAFTITRQPIFHLHLLTLLCLTHGNSGIWTLQCQQGACLSPLLPAVRTGKWPYAGHGALTYWGKQCPSFEQDFQPPRRAGDAVSIKSKKRYGWKGQADFALPQSGKAPGKKQK